MAQKKTYPLVSSNTNHTPRQGVGKQRIRLKRNNEPIESINQAKETSVLEEVIQEGARRLLQAAIEHEVAEYIACFQNIKDEQGRRKVVKNGFLPERSILTGIGPLAVKKPRVRDNREGEFFTSTILPRYLRRVPSLDNLIPTLYLYLPGISWKPWKPSWVRPPKGFQPTP